MLPILSPKNIQFLKFEIRQDKIYAISSIKWVVQVMQLQLEYL